MNKSELISEIAQQSGLTKTQVGNALEAFMNCVAATLRKKDEVRLTGFGTFLTTHRPAGTMRNPQTGAMIRVEASLVPRFRSGASLKAVVNGKTAAPKKTAPKKAPARLRA
jgi:DNA-binding protein HU-beta